MPMQISTTRSFSAAHQLVLYDGSLEPLHGHNWQVRVTVSAKKLDKIGVVMDFHDLEARLDALIGPLHNNHLNQAEPFQKRNPSAENIALYFAENLKLPKKIALVSVEVWETATNSAVWFAC